jgi:hypothetical protein
MHELLQNGVVPRAKDKKATQEEAVSMLASQASGC